MTVHYYQMNGNLFRILAHQQSAQPASGVADSTKFKLINKLLETLFASAGAEDYKNINMSTGMGEKDIATFVQDSEQWLIDFVFMCGAHAEWIWIFGAMSV